MTMNCYEIVPLISWIDVWSISHNFPQNFPLAIDIHRQERTAALEVPSADLAHG